MKIQDLLRKDVMLLDLQATEKTAVIEEMIKSLTEHGYVTDFETFKEGILARESLTSTGLGDGIAMPHSKNAAVKEATVLFAKSNKGVDYESLDGQPTDLFFMIAAPEGANDTHLAALAELSQYLMKDGFADKLRQATSADQVIELFDLASEKLKNLFKHLPMTLLTLSLLLQLVRQVLLTLTWLKKPFKKWLLKWVLELRSKPTVPVVLVTN
ncbi:PTS system, fructose subfamily, IIA component domain protein [Streptococcus mitis]|uniref:PTS system, fructose subfamily, IIA component domain protein n=1 Tax=Streptococcus mitis TaxID=28037 RepID=A0A081PRS6_STRMT|nr:PTS system, fructose subfamily, IIA component domain protein [Streptococcus mitis]